jgi:cytidine deaminase
VEERRTGRERRSGKSGSAAAAPGRQERRRDDRRGTSERRDDRAWQPVAVELPDRSGFSPERGLLAAALAAREFAHAHYSHFKVGAALETTDGAIITGCNVENASYGLTVCAERVALLKALSEGHTMFTRIAVVAATPEPTPPCGPCRQLLWEYCGDIEVILGNADKILGHHRLHALLPLPFDRRLL